MIQEIHINQYKKLKNLDLSFSPSINAISGANGTCKTSLLYMISNSFQEINKTNSNLENENSLNIIKRLNDNLNPKIESITKGDKKSNDPAPGVPGILYTVNYFNAPPLGFRRHNSRRKSKFPRYAMKPLYQKGDNNSLPALPILYLGLARLMPFGEIVEQTTVSNLSANLPDDYLDELNAIYKNLTSINVNQVKTQEIKGIKKRDDFMSCTDGIDSNTISAGEDNIRIILNSLFSLKYYYDSLKNTDNIVNSILIIDEFDATLHPSMQQQLFNIVKDFSEKYKIQVFFTTHSLYLIDWLLSLKEKVIYLVDNHDSVTQIENPSSYQIELHLNNKTSFDLYKNKYIPILTEDSEARIFISLIFSYLKEKDPNGFGGIASYLEMIDVNMGSGVLEKLFSHKHMGKISLNAICILDGDQQGNLSNNIISLPGNDNPEQLVFKYIEEKLLDDMSFWSEPSIIRNGFSKKKYIQEIQKDIHNIEHEIEEIKEKKQSINGIKRKLQKTVFNDHIEFFKIIISHWILNKENKDGIIKFHKNLHSIFRKTSTPNGINPDIWEYKKTINLENLQ